MNKLTSRFAAVAVIGAVAFGSLTVAEAASAATIIPATIQLHSAYTNVSTIGPVITTGSASASPMFNGLTTSTGCPANFRGRSDTAIFQNGTRLGNISTSRNASVTLYGATGLDGNPIAMDDTYSIPSINPFVANKSIGSLNPVPGAFEMRIYCSPTSATVDYVNDPYMLLNLTLSSDSSTWSVAVPAAATTVSLTGALGSDNASAVLTATVKNASTTAVATDATGSVTFTDGTTTKTATVANGVATVTYSALGYGSYSFTATFVPTGTAYNGSTSGAVSVVVPQVGAITAASNITVAIPAGVGSLTLTGVQSSIDLGTAVLNGGLLKASGVLGPVVVTDTRQLDAANWSLTGQTTNFTAGTKVLDGKYLGWAPVLQGSNNAGTAGAAVLPAPGSTNGLKTASSLATGPVVDGKPTTTVQAALNLAAPANTPAGAYSATLTITLV